MIFSDHGIIVPDTSFYQDDNSTPQGIDFVKMKQAGAKGVILRGGQNTWRDEDFLRNKQAAKEAGLPRGYYWFYDSRSDPVWQARLWASLIGEDLPELGLWYDFEESYLGAYRGERYWKEFALTVDALYPTVKRGIYTARWWWDNQIVNDPDFWAGYLLWVAQYEVRAEDIILPRPWRNKGVVFWQYTASGDGLKYGVESLEIDLNLFNGDESLFNSFFNIQQGEPEPMADYIELRSTVATEYRSIRDQVSYPNPPHIFGATSISKRILAGNVGKANPTDFYRYAQDVIISGEVYARTGDIWWKVYEANGTAISGWAAEIHKGIRYLNTRLVTETLPPSEEYIIHVKDGVQRKFILDE